MISLEQWKKMAEIGVNAPNVAGYQSIMDTVMNDYEQEMDVIESQLDLIDLDEDGNAVDPGDDDEYERLLDKRDRLIEAYQDWDEFTFIDYVKYLNHLNRRLQ